MRPVRDASDRDAEYLACQMYTNSRVMGYQSRMQRARDRLHTVYLEVSQLDDAAPAPLLQRIAEAPLPPIDRTISTPRTRSTSGTRITAPNVASLMTLSDPPAGLYAFGSAARARLKEDSR